MYIPHVSACTLNNLSNEIPNSSLCIETSKEAVVTPTHKIKTMNVEMK